MGMVNPRSDSPSAETNDHVAVGSSWPSSPLLVRASLPLSSLPVRASLPSSPLPVRASLPSSPLPVRASLPSSTLPAAHMDSTALFQELSTWSKTLSGMAAASTFLDANVPAVAAAAEVLHFSRFSAGQRCTKRKEDASLAAPHQDHYHSEPTCSSSAINRPSATKTLTLSVLAAVAGSPESAAATAAHGAAATTSSSSVDVVPHSLSMPAYSRLKLCSKDNGLSLAEKRASEIFRQKNKEAQRRLRDKHKNTVLGLEMELEKRNRDLEQLRREKRMVEEHNRVLLERVQHLESTTI
ncbi:hypothetical protein CEUSTIGMA_g2683.t1 [Chlamydomonas eustigma]|uniref:BZIP domain-containing protein n=1 Tax=Chlamydomonas eustigma TaxID=1157962 RepID=A0A250WWM3_9CHLO|nr:hypothetical protein CEUSTIGMA_g2683.t1 [Chlamydomonas eustigma]|eukprot:GAX75238.1 hypothetical protein CEUSTIGMA_g2683.t1 [Chlamydomonas eustigma]